MTRSKQSETNLEDPFVYMGKLEICAKFQKSIKLYGSWSSVFQTNLPGFSKTLEPCLNIWHFALINKYYQVTKKINPCKPILY